MGKRGHLDKGEEGGGGRRWLILLCQIFPNLHTRQVISLPQIGGKRILLRFPTSRKNNTLVRSNNQAAFFLGKGLVYVYCAHDRKENFFSSPSFSRAAYV